MIRCIVAIDDQRGLANEQGIPWKLPADQQYFRRQTEGGTVVMGAATYQEFAQPLPNRQNLVLTTQATPLRTGFEFINNIDILLQKHFENLWIIGGANVFAQMLQFAEELYITRVYGDFGCTKFFPPFEQDFRIIRQSDICQDADIRFCFEIWQREK
jgi:dihydrofolate reductase